jgi:hypothetical protein
MAKDIVVRSVFRGCHDGCGAWCVQKGEGQFRKEKENSLAGL